MNELLQIVQAIGVPAAIILLVLMIVRDRNKAASTTESTVATIAGTSTHELTAVYKQLGDIRQDLGMAQGQVIILQDNIKTAETKRLETEEKFKEKISALEEKSKQQTVTISRHEGRIAELETESKRKDAIIEAKENEIIELTAEKTRLQTTIETQHEEIKGLNKELLLLKRVQSLDDTIPLGDELIEKANAITEAKPTLEIKPKEETSASPETPITPLETKEEKDKENAA